MTPVRHASLIFALAAGAAAGCEQVPSAPPPDAAPVVTGAPADVAPAGLTRLGNVMVAGGAAADSLVRATAARWAAQGHRSLQTFVDTSRQWDGAKQDRPIVRGPGAVRDVAGYADLSYLDAEVYRTDLEVTVNGNRGVVTATSSYTGTNAHLDLTFGANYEDGTVDVPTQSHGFDDTRAGQKVSCALEVMSGSTYLPDCYYWTGTVVGSAVLSLAHSCGEYVHGSATTTAWFELPIPKLTVSSTGSGSVAFSWLQFGRSSPFAMGNREAHQEACPTEITTTPACGSQIIYDGSTCDPSGEASIDSSLGGPSDDACQYYLVTISESYDGGYTWTVVYQTIEQIC